MSDHKPGALLLWEFAKAQGLINNLSERLEVAENFIRKIIRDWGCDPNHAAAIMNELERLKKENQQNE